VITLTRRRVALGVVCAGLVLLPAFGGASNPPPASSALAVSRAAQADAPTLMVLPGGPVALTSSAPSPTRTSVRRST
jgi:hypothetical protein